MADIICPVRNCASLLIAAEKSLRCQHGHHFDRARSGYYNLLQPQDKRSKNPGDSKAAVMARRRLLASGHEAPIVQAILQMIASLPLPPESELLDAGCGEGYYLGSLAAAQPFSCYGIDISIPAIDMAARSYPQVNWLVANADRKLPFADASFQLISSITARRNPPEFHRLLKKNGWLLIALPGEDDLIELREAVIGKGTLKNRVAQTVAALQQFFTLEKQQYIKHEARLTKEMLTDLLAATYRTGRATRSSQMEQLDEMTVTLSRDLLILSAN